MSIKEGQKRTTEVRKSSLLRTRRNVPNIARAVVLSSSNNNIISISDSFGNIIVQSSAGACGFKGTRKATPYAAQVTATEVGKIALELGIKCVNVLIRGIGSGRDSAVLALQNTGIKISAISFDINIPHNGCRPRKRRRV